MAKKTSRKSKTAERSKDRAKGKSKGQSKGQSKGKTRSMLSVGDGERLHEPVRPVEAETRGTATRATAARKGDRTTSHEASPPRETSSGCFDDDRHSVEALTAAHRALLAPLKAALAETQTLIDRHEAALSDAARDIALPPRDAGAGAREYMGTGMRKGMGPVLGAVPGFSGNMPFAPFSFSPTAAQAAFAPAQGMALAGIKAWTDGMQRTQAFWTNVAGFWLGAAGGQGAGHDVWARAGGPKRGNDSSD